MSHQYFLLSPEIDAGTGEKQFIFTGLTNNYIMLMIQCKIKHTKTLFHFIYGTTWDYEIVMIWCNVPSMQDVVYIMYNIIK